MAIALYELIPYFLLSSYLNPHINIKQKHLLETQIGHVTLTQNSTMASLSLWSKCKRLTVACKTQHKQPPAWLSTRITQSVHLLDTLSFFLLLKQIELFLAFGTLLLPDTLFSRDSPEMDLCQLSCLGCSYFPYSANL